MGSLLLTFLVGRDTPSGHRGATTLSCCAQRQAPLEPSGVGPQTTQSPRPFVPAARWAQCLMAALSLLFLGCTPKSNSHAESAAPTDASAPRDAAPAARAAVPSASASAPALPLLLVRDAPLPGKAVRFDYQDLDVAKGNLVIAHMNDASVLIVKASDGALVKLIPKVPTPRGVVVAKEVGRIFVTSSPNKLVIIDNTSLEEVARVETGSGPDAVAWDPVHQIVAVSDQGDGAVSLISESGSGARKQVALGTETGNVVFDATRAVFWVTVVTASHPDQLMAVDPVANKTSTKIALSGCSGAHGLRVHPDGKSAFIACEDSAKVLRVDLADGRHALESAATGVGPDVLAIDPGLGWLYVAAESGDLRVFDIRKSGLALVGSQHPADASHSVAIDPQSHRVFFPLVRGVNGTPVLRIMQPTGT